MTRFVSWAPAFIGKTLLDVTNALTEDMQLATGCTASGAERLQQIAHGARVVKAFNSQFAAHMDSGRVDGQPVTVSAANTDFRHDPA